MKFQQNIFALSKIIQVLISLEFTLFNIIPNSLVTLQFLKFLLLQMKAYIQGFQIKCQSFSGHWYPNSYSWFSDSMDIPFVLITTVVTKILSLYFWEPQFFNLPRPGSLWLRKIDTNQLASINVYLQSVSD